MKYAKKPKCVNGTVVAKPPYGAQVFATIIHKANIFDRETGKRRLMADRWEIYMHLSPSRTLLIGRIRRTVADGYAAQFVFNGATTQWCEVKNVAEAKREAFRYAA